MALPLSRDSRWIFIGDSITDCGRVACSEAIGSGYVRAIRDWLRASVPALAPQILNKGISGNTISDLKRRWQADVIAQDPQLVSVKIGINDVWHALTGAGEGSSLERFRDTYAEILGRLRTFLSANRDRSLRTDRHLAASASARGNDLLKPYVATVSDAAVQLGARGVVPLHGIFEKARSARPDINWAPDGVHPSSSGHMLITRSWLACLGLL